MDGLGISMLERLPLGRGRAMPSYGSALLICIVALLIRLFASPLLGSGYPYVSFFPAVILTALLFGTGPGIFAGILCGLFAWYCFIPPFFAVKMSGTTAFALLFYSVVVAVDIVVIDRLQHVIHRLAAERERSRKLAERSELLFRELQHRVSNNLQVISGLLALQRRAISDEEARLALDDASRRLSLIGRIHRQLYDPQGEQLHLTAFLDQITLDLIDTGGKQGVVYRIEAEEDVDLPPDAVVPIALIVAEAIANAIEHGFADRDHGLILIRVSCMADGGLELRIVDDGAGLPAGFDLAKADSLGLKLAQMLARQLGGSFTLFGADPTTAMLCLPPRSKIGSTSSTG